MSPEHSHPSLHPPTSATRNPMKRRLALSALLMLCAALLSALPLLPMPAARLGARGGMR